MTDNDRRDQIALTVRRLSADRSMGLTMDESDEIADALLKAGVLNAPQAGPTAAQARRVVFSGPEVDDLLRLVRTALDRDYLRQEALSQALGWADRLAAAPDPTPATAPATLTDEERRTVARAVETVSLAVTSKAAVTWGMPLLDILQTEGHADNCDAVLASNVTACDCWWARVKRAASALSEIATAADDASPDPESLPDVVERIKADAYAAGLAARTAPTADQETLARVRSVPDWLSEDGRDPQSVAFVRVNIAAALGDADQGGSDRG